jgi:hypothetical protein
VVKPVLLVDQQLAELADSENRVLVIQTALTASLIVVMVIIIIHTRAIPVVLVEIYKLQEVVVMDNRLHMAVLTVLVVQQVLTIQIMVLLVLH